MGLGFVLPTAYTVRKIFSPTIFTSTVADSSTITSATVGADAYHISIECLAGNLMVDPTGAAVTTAAGWKIPAGETITMQVKKSDANLTGRVALFGLSTTDVYQAIVWE